MSTLGQPHPPRRAECSLQARLLALRRAVFRSSLALVVEVVPVMAYALTAPGGDPAGPLAAVQGFAMSRSRRARERCCDDRAAWQHSRRGNRTAGTAGRELQLPCRDGRFSSAGACCTATVPHVVSGCHAAAASRHPCPCSLRSCPALPWSVDAFPRRSVSVPERRSVLLIGPVRCGPSPAAVRGAAVSEARSPRRAGLALARRRLRSPRRRPVRSSSRHAPTAG